MQLRIRVRSTIWISPVAELCVAQERLLAHVLYRIRSCSQCHREWSCSLSYQEVLGNCFVEIFFGGKTCRKTIIINHSIELDVGSGQLQRLLKADSQEKAPKHTSGRLFQTIRLWPLLMTLFEYVWLSLWNSLNILELFTIFGHLCLRRLEDYWAYLSARSEWKPVLDHFVKENKASEVLAATWLQWLMHKLLMAVLHNMAWTHNRLIMFVYVHDSSSAFVCHLNCHLMPPWKSRRMMMTRRNLPKIWNVAYCMDGSQRSTSLVLLMHFYDFWWLHRFCVFGCFWYALHAFRFWWVRKSFAEFLQIIKETAWETSVSCISALTHCRRKKWMEPLYSFCRAIGSLTVWSPLDPEHSHDGLSNPGPSVHVACRANPFCRRRVASQHGDRPGLTQHELAKRGQFSIVSTFDHRYQELMLFANVCQARCQPSSAHDCAKARMDTCAVWREISTVAVHLWCSFGSLLVLAISPLPTWAQRETWKD